MEMTLLSAHQIWGDNNRRGKLEVMKRYGTKTGISDLAVLLGGEVGDSTFTSDGQRSGIVCSIDCWDKKVHAVGADGNVSLVGSALRYSAVRPVLPSHVAPSIDRRIARHKKLIFGLKVVEYGEYPQTVVSGKIASELEQAFSENALNTTGKKYMFNVFDLIHSDDLRYNLQPHDEFQYHGAKYVRVKAQPYDSYSFMSNEVLPLKGKPYWVKVEPVEWFVEPSIAKLGKRSIHNPAAGLWIAKQGLLSGVPMLAPVPYENNNANKTNYYQPDYRGDFESTTLYNYLQEHLLKEIQPSRTLPELKKATTNGKLRESLRPTNKISEISKVPAATRPELDRLLHRIYGTYYQEELAMSVHQLLGAPKDNPYSKEALAAWQTGKLMPSAEELEAITELAEAAIPPARRRVWDAMKKNLQACYDAVIANPLGEAAKENWKNQLGVVWKEWDGTAAGNDIKAQLLSNYFGRIDPEHPNLEFLMLEYDAGRLRVSDRVCQAIEDATVTEDGHGNIIPGINVREAMKLPNPEPEQPLSKPEKKKPGFLGIPPITLPFGKSVTER